ncbi:MAG: hypothetical protein R3346_03350, partial [Candidatus Spechtbacterales bacterium]|nr:hypothetical protein [Candidatus Spechtbacterales bacterium]
YDIQKRKQELMKELHEKLQCLDNPDCEIEKEPNSILVRYDKAKNEFIIINEDGTEEQVTYGEILTDGEWGVLYHLDKKTVPRNTIKKYLIEQTKRQLRHELDLQIIFSEKSGIANKISKGQLGNQFKSRVQAYENYHAALEEERLEDRVGVWAEKMVKNIFKKMIYDHGVGLVVSDVDIFEDIEHKIDFIIKRAQHKRGVRVEEIQDAQDIGIQITANGNKGVHKRKRRQISNVLEKQEVFELVDDIALVFLSSKKISPAINEWEDRGRPPGGPDKILSEDTIEKIFKQVLEGLLPPEEIENYWMQRKNSL